MRKKNKFPFLFISFFFAVLSCEEKSIPLADLSPKDKEGNIQILVATPSQSKIYIRFDDIDQRFIKTKKSYSLNKIAHTGYLAGKTILQKVIVLGKTAKTGKLISTLPIGIIRLVTEEQTTNWQVYADITSEICGLEDFVLNHHPLKNALQTKLKMIEETKKFKITWFDEDFLEFKINQAQ